jgi:hypothetical protein
MRASLVVMTIGFGVIGISVGFPGRDAIPAGLEGDGNAFDPASCHLCFLSPPIQQLQQCALVDGEILQRLALDARHDTYTSQLTWLISITAIIVPPDSNGVRDRLRSFDFYIGRSIKEVRVLANGRDLGFVRNAGLRPSAQAKEADRCVRFA